MCGEHFKMNEVDGMCEYLYVLNGVCSHLLCGIDIHCTNSHFVTNMESSSWVVLMTPQVTFATSEHLQADTSPSDSTKYKEITNLRVRLLGQFDLGSDEGYQYYSVGEWLVWGTCMCNGHASTCAPAPGEPLASDKVYTCYKKMVKF